jgi:hypothetical protein
MKIILPLSLLFFSASCASDSSDATKNDSDSVAPKVVTVPALKKGLNDLYVFSDPSNTYEAYLPSGYDTSKKFPVVIFFDAHGNGTLPVDKYKAIAEKWQYIFIGCNSTKNGMAMNETMRLGSELINEIQVRFPVDVNEIAICGFSGGARVAAGLGQNPSNLKGVICNSAAPQAAMDGKVFIGLAGLGDMNYLEMKKFVDGQKTLQNKFPNELLVFDGKHEWAPVDVMEDAILMVNAYDLRNDSQPNDVNMIAALDSNIALQADSIRKTSCKCAQDLITSFYDLKFTDWHQLSLRKWKCDVTLKKISSSCVSSDEAAWKKAEDQESTMQTELSNAMLGQDTMWWKTNAPVYFDSTKTGAEKYMRERLQGYASLMAYSYTNQAFKMSNPHATDKLITIYSIVDPKNCEWAYMRAEFYMNIGMQDAVFPMLQKAVDLGFDDRNRLSADPVFAPLQNDARMSEIFVQMK